MWISTDLLSGDFFFFFFFGQVKPLYKIAISRDRKCMLLDITFNAELFRLHVTVRCFIFPCLNCYLGEILEKLKLNNFISHLLLWHSPQSHQFNYYHLLMLIPDFNNSMCVVETNNFLSKHFGLKANLCNWDLNDSGRQLSTKTEIFYERYER